MSQERIGAIVLAGGTATRLGGTDKLAVAVGGRPVLDRVLGALAGDCPAVVVGPPRATSRPVHFVREQPPGGGPVAGLAAGLAAADTELIYLLAGDLPFVTPTALAALAAALSSYDGVMAIDDAGRAQPLLSVWRTDALRRAVPAEPAGAPLLRTLAGLEVASLPMTEHPPPWWDCDTPAAFEQAKEWAR